MSIVALATDFHDVAGKRRGHGQEWRLKETNAVPIEDLDLEGLIAVVVNGKSEERASHHILLTLDDTPSNERHLPEYGSCCNFGCDD